jgi:hypothetical protein
MTSERGRTLRSLAVAGGLAGLVAGCADFSRGPAQPAVDAAAEQTEGGALSFVGVHALLLPACGGCHAAGEEAGDTGLLFSGDAATDLATVRSFVNVDAPASSRLVTKMAGNGHQGGTIFGRGTPEYATVVTWIQGGALP